MIVSEIDLYEALKEKLGEEEAKKIVEFLKQQAQSEVRLVAEEIFQKIDEALGEMKNIEKEALEETKISVKQIIEDALQRVENIVDLKVSEISSQLTKLDGVNEKLDAVESRLSEIANKVNEISGKTGGVKGLMFFLWLLLIATVIFDILLNIPATRNAILSALGGGSS